MTHKLKRKTLKAKLYKEIADNNREIYALKHRNKFLESNQEKLVNEIGFCQLAMSVLGELCLGGYCFDTEHSSPKGDLSANEGKVITISQEDFTKAMERAKDQRVAVDFNQQDKEYYIKLVTLSAT